jgi:hypothetical protein
MLYARGQPLKKRDTIAKIIEIWEETKVKARRLGRANDR